MTTPQLRVELRRSGGFAGRDLHCSLDAGDLPPAQAQQFADAVAALDLDGLATASQTRAAGPGRDLMSYHLQVQRDGRHWRFDLHEPDVPPAARPLLQRLLDAAR